MIDPLIIMSAPNGARRQKADHPQLPISPDDMAECAELILANGASILHLHVRDENNRHSLNVDRYRASIKAIRNAVGSDLIIQATTEAVGIYNRQQQMDMVKTLKPEATSLALRELCPSDNELQEFAAFNQWIISQKILPQYILYDENDYLRFEAYRKQGVFHQEQPFTLFVLGSYHGRSDEIDQMTEKMTAHAMKASFPWAVCGFDVNEKPCTTHAIKNGGHVRVGFENNIMRNDKQILKDSGEMIKFCTSQAIANARPIQNADNIRNIFDIRG